MSKLLITNARLFTAVDETVIDDGSVLIDGDRIVWAGPTGARPSARTTESSVLDVGGRFVMPGMTESHVHLSYSNAHPSKLDRQPIPIAMLDAVDNARTLLRFGFTSAISFGSAQGIDVPLRDAINAGRVPGPRLLASEKDVGSTGSNADSKEPGSDGRKRIADGPWAVRAAVREVAKAGADVVKIFLDGEALSAHAAPGVLSYTDEEVAAACDEARLRHLRVAVPCPVGGSGQAGGAPRRRFRRAMRTSSTTRRSRCLPKHATVSSSGRASPGRSSCSNVVTRSG